MSNLLLRLLFLCAIFLGAFCITVGNGKAVGNWSVDYWVNYDAASKICRLADVSVSADNRTGSLTIVYPATMTLKGDSLLSGWKQVGKKNVAGDKKGLCMVAYAFPKTATDDQIENFLAKLQFISTNQGRGSISVYIDASTQATAPYYHEDGTYHYYRFVEFEEGQERSFANAYATAKKTNFLGYKGYLTTLTSKKEHDLVFDSIASQPGYLGGMRLVESDGNRPMLDQDTIDVSKLIFATAVNDKGTPWYWVSGPETGENFCADPVRIGREGKNWVDEDDYHGPKGMKSFNFWTDKEPSNSKYEVERDEAPNPRNRRGEGVIQFAYNNSERWNDIGLYGCYYNETWNGEAGDKSNYVVDGYYVEFGGYKGENPPENGTTYATVTREWIEPDNGKDGDDKQEETTPPNKGTKVTYPYGMGNLTKVALLGLIRNANDETYQRIKDATPDTKNLHQVNEAIRKHREGTYTIYYQAQNGARIPVEVKLVGSSLRAKEKILTAVLGQVISIEDLVNDSGILARDANGMIIDPARYKVNEDELAELNRVIRLGIPGTYRVTLYAPDGTPYTIQVIVPEGEMAIDDEEGDDEEPTQGADTGDSGLPQVWLTIGVIAGLASFASGRRLW